MTLIENKLRSEGTNIYQIYEDVWTREINNYLKENNITIEDDVVFRPHMNHNLKNKNNEDDVFYYRITKTDLINYEINYEQFDYTMIIEYESDESEESFESDK
jgi:hypothetical protein